MSELPSSHTLKHTHVWCPLTSIIHNNRISVIHVCSLTDLRSCNGQPATDFTNVHLRSQFSHVHYTASLTTALEGWQRHYSHNLNNVPTLYALNVSSTVLHAHSHSHLTVIYISKVIFYLFSYFVVRNYCRFNVLTSFKCRNFPFYSPGFKPAILTHHMLYTIA